MRGSLPVVKVYYRYSIAPVNSFSGFVSMRPQRFYSVSSSSRSSRSDDVFKITNHLVEKTPITAQLWNMRRNANTTPLTLQDSHNHNTNGITTNEADAMTLQTKIPIDSQVIIHYNFTQDDHLRDMYADHTGGILIGKLFEDLDALAGNIAHSHCDSTKRNLALVTASVDRIIQTKHIPITCDMMLIGRVVWVGTSSLDIMIEIQSTGDSASESLFSCFFTYVARSKSTNRAAPVNKLELNTEIEKKLFQTRQELADQRKKASSNIHSDYSNIQSEITKLLEAGNAVEDMPALAHPNAVLMKSTVLENSLVCQPQNTNTSGRVFGGFLSKYLMFDY